MINKNGNVNRLKDNVVSGTHMRNGLSVTLNTDLTIAVKRLAKATGIPLSRIIDKALYDYLGHYDPDADILQDGWTITEIEKSHDIKMNRYRDKN